MRKKGETEKRQGAEMASTLGRIEASAAASYESDLREAEAHKRATLGEWVSEGAPDHSQQRLHSCVAAGNTGGEVDTWTATVLRP